MSTKQDTAGQERYRTITTAYYRGAMGFILMYDVTNEESFNSVQDWVTQIKTYSWDNAQVILVGNKCDCSDERVVSFDRGRQLADQLGLEFFETSAKENVNVKAVFERLVDVICDRMSETLDSTASSSDNVLRAGGGTRLDNNPGTPNANCNCWWYLSWIMMMTMMLDYNVVDNVNCVSQTTNNIIINPVFVMKKTHTLLLFYTTCIELTRKNNNKLSVFTMNCTHSMHRLLLIHWCLRVHLLVWCSSSRPLRLSQDMMMPWQRWRWSTTGQGNP